MMRSRRTAAYSNSSRLEASLPKVEENGFVLYYTDQCPYTYYWVPKVQEVAREHGIPFNAIHITEKAVSYTHLDVYKRQGCSPISKQSGSRWPLSRCRALCITSACWQRLEMCIRDRRYTENLSAIREAFPHYFKA